MRSVAGVRDAVGVLVAQAVELNPRHAGAIHAHPRDAVGVDDAGVAAASVARDHEQTKEHQEGDAREQEREETSRRETSGRLRCPPSPRCPTIDSGVRLSRSCLVVGIRGAPLWLALDSIALRPTHTSTVRAVGLDLGRHDGFRSEK